jgi:hypothetical protein
VLGFSSVVLFSCFAILHIEVMDDDCFVDLSIGAPDGFLQQLEPAVVMCCLSSALNPSDVVSKSHG